jgi:Holliday junction resolvase RusA-like endonuclease
VASLVMVATKGKWKPLSGDVALSIIWYRGAKRGDLDNRLKVVLDSLSGVAYVDDRQIVQLTATREDRPRRPGLYVEVRAA